MHKRFQKCAAFTLVELLVAISLAVVASGLIYLSAQEIAAASERREVENLAHQLNQAVDAYILSGGTISAEMSAGDVLATLKSSLSNSSKRLSVSVSDLLRRDLALTSVGADNSRPVVTYSNTRFAYARDGGGFRISIGEASEATTSSLSVDGLTYNPETTGWIWKHEGTSTGPSPIVAVANKLIAPSFLYSGDVPLTQFPLRDILEFPANPFGTVYHYTIDGSAPDSSSPVWDNPNVGIATLPPAFRAIAIHPDPNWTDSDIAQTSIFAQLEITYLREDGSDDTTFEFLDVIGDVNRIVLDVPGIDPTLYEIRYSGDGTVPTVGSTLFAAPFHFLAFEWPASGRTLQARAYAKSDTMLSDSPILEHLLMPIATQLPTPLFDVDASSGPVIDGTVTSVSNGMETYSEFRGSYGEELPSMAASLKDAIPITLP